MDYEIDIVVVEDNPDLRSGYEFLLSNDPGFNLLATFEDAESALAKMAKLNPDVVLVDLELPGMQGDEFIDKAKKIVPKTYFLVLTVHEDDTHVFNALMRGASGYVTKNSSHAEIVTSIQDVMKGGAPMSSKIAKMVVQSFKIESDFDLTAREIEVLKTLAQGLTYDQIAEKLFVSTETIKTHLKSIYLKLNVKNKADAVFKALKNNIIR